MLKKITELNKIEKIMLLKLILDKEIDKKALTPETLIGTEKSDAFLSLIVKSGNKNINIVNIGVAKNALAEAGIIPYK